MALERKTLSPNPQHNDPFCFGAVAEVTMSQIAHIASLIFKGAANRERFIVAIAGPPGAGKSTLSSALVDLLPEGSSIVLPMDGFHYDDGVLAQRGWSARKGAPHTFDFGGFESMLKRVRASCSQPPRAPMGRGGQSGPSSPP